MDNENNFFAVRGKSNRRRKKDIIQQKEKQLLQLDKTKIAKAKSKTYRWKDYSVKNKKPSKYSILQQLYEHY